MNANRALSIGVGLVEFTLVILMGIFAARLFWLFVASGHPSVQMNQISTPVFGVDASSVSVDRSILTRFDPFFRDIDFVSGEVVDDAPETTLNLTIETLLSSTDSRLRSVRIRMPSDNRVIAFREGETILSGVKVDRILGDRIILINQGEQQTLLLRETPFTALTEVDVTDQQSPPDNVQTTTLISSASSPKGDLLPEPEQTVERYRVDNLLEFYRAVSVEPMAGDGSAIGYVVSSEEQGSLAAIGLASGDVLTEVNGQDIADVKQDELLQLIGENTTLRLRLLRGTETRTLEITVGDD